MKYLKYLWILASLVVLFVTLSIFDGATNSDIAIFLIFSMATLSAPVGYIIMIVYGYIAMFFGVTGEVSYLYLSLVWGVLFASGYVQWFVIFPWLWRRWKLRGSTD